MSKIQWSYHRNGCKTCGKTQAFLAAHELAADEQVDARKVRIQAADALALARQVNDIYATRGQKVIHLNMKKDHPDDETLVKLLIGPSGNLRAPTLRKGKTLVVGFDQETYEQIFD